MAVTKVWQDPVVYSTAMERRSVHRLVTQAVIDLRWQLAPFLESLPLNFQVNHPVPVTVLFEVNGVPLCLVYTSTETDYINFKLTSFVQVAVGLASEASVLRDIMEGLL